MKRFEAFVNFLMPDYLNRFVEKNGERVIDRYLFFATLLVIFIGITFLFGIFHLFAEGLTKKAGTQFFSFFMLLTCFLLYKKSPWYYFPILLPFFVSMIHLPIKFYQHGQILSPTPIWFLTIPPIIIYLVGNRVGFACYLIYLIEYTITCFLIKDGAPLTNIEYVFIFSVAISSFVWLFFIITLNATQEKWDHELKDRVLQESHNAHLISLGEMAGTVAHEINNPLAIIRGNAQSLKKELESEGKNQKKIEKIIKNSDRVKEIVNSLSSLAHKPIEKTNHHQGAHLSLAFSQFINLTRETLHENNIDLIYNEDDLNVVFPCRPETLANTLISLTQNSIFAIKSQEKPWIKISVHILPDRICLIFADSGKGLSRSVAARIFEPFYTTKPQGEGTGIGLSIIKNELLNERGTIQYDSKSEYTTFKIEFPTN